MLEWQNATACTRRYLRPDGYGIYRRNGRRFGFFLEFDRGNMNRRDYFKKLSAYFDYAANRRYERDYHSYPTTLVVTTSNGVEERIARVEREAAVGRSVSLPLVLTSCWRIDESSNADGFLGPIWRDLTQKLTSLGAGHNRGWTRAAIVGTEVTTMKVVTVRDFRDRATEMFRSEDVILVTRDGKPAGFYIPWDQPDVPIELKRELFTELTDQIGAQLDAAGATEEEILADFAEWRAARRRHR